MEPRTTGPREADLVGLSWAALFAQVPPTALELRAAYEQWQLTGDGAAFANELEEYWKHGEGAAKIRWGTPGDFKRCVSHLEKPDKELGPERAKRICAQWHHDINGFWPGDKRNK